jgi:kynureninase
MEAYVARAGMAWLRALGLDAVERWNRALSEHLADRAHELGLAILEPRNPAARAPTTAFTCADSHGVEERLRRRGVIASARGPALRLAPHFYNTLDDVDQAVEALAEELEEGSTAA